MLSLRQQCWLLGINRSSIHYEPMEVGEETLQLMKLIDEEYTRRPFIWWRSVKYEGIYLKDYQTVQQTQEGLKRYFECYNSERYHQWLEYRTPDLLTEHTAA